MDDDRETVDMATVKLEEPDPHQLLQLSQQLGESSGGGGTAAGQRSYSDNTDDVCVVQCKFCLKPIALDCFTYHIKKAHNVHTQEYGEKKFLRRTYHRCKICEHELLFSGSSVGCHVIAAHKMSFIQYKAQFLQFRERRSRSASGLDLSGQQQHNNNGGGSLGHHQRRNSTNKTRWCAQWYNGASYACTVCPFRTHVRTRMTKHVRAEHPERLGTKRTGATDGVFETTFGRFRCEFCGEEVCHNKTEIVRHLECHAMDLDTYRRLYLPSSSVVVSAASGGEAVIVARRKPPPPSSASQNSATASVIAYGSSSASGSDQRNSRRRSEDDSGGGGSDERNSGAAGGHLSHQLPLRGDNNSGGGGSWQHMESGGRVSDINEMAPAHQHQRATVLGYGGSGLLAEPPLGGWKIERPPSVDDDSNKDEEEAAVAAAQKSLDSRRHSEERGGSGDQLGWKQLIAAAGMDQQQLAQAALDHHHPAVSTADQDVVSGHPPASSLLMMPDNNDLRHHHLLHHPHHHVPDLVHHHLQQQQLIGSNHHEQQLPLHLPSRHLDPHHHLDDGGLRGVYGGGRDEEEEGDVDGSGGGRPPDMMLERFRCPFPDCNFWTDLNGLRNGLAAQHVQAVHGYLGWRFRSEELRFIRYED